MTGTQTLHPPDGYRPPVGAHDEMMRADGLLREPWADLLSEYQNIGTTELHRRNHEIQRILEQDGVTYNVGDDRPRPGRPWSLDPIPFVLSSDEWSVIERGMIQRAEALDLVLADLYGERRLLRAGIVPPEMILSDPQFLRACDGIRLAGRAPSANKQLIVLGADIVRAEDGRWLALGHRAEAPSGAAFSFENRRVLSRVFPHLIHTTGVQRLTPFVEALRSALLAVVPDGVDDPSIVILSPGSLSETAFEHASMAAQLGYPLVQGSDFELRDGRVGLRAVGGWAPVHVILRRVDAGFCDPLVLRSDSTLGVPGLVDACRAGTVSVVNTLGSGILENAGLAGLMPSLVRHLFDSDLVVESVPSWWCGDDAERSHVLANLGRLVIRPLSRLGLQHSIDTTRSSLAELDELRRRIGAEPTQWVGQERSTPGSAPALTPQGIEPRPTVLRSFVVAADDSFVAMPGGLARTAAHGDGPITSRVGATSKDIWVVGPDSDRRPDVVRPGADRASHTSAGVLPARAAEHLFWLGRYAERAEATVRLVRTIATRHDEFAKTDTGAGPASLVTMLEALTRITGTFPGFVGDDAERLLADPPAELFSLVVDERRPGTVAHAVGHLLAALDVVRDQMSLDTWLIVGSLQRELEGLGEDVEDDHGADRDEAMANVLNELLRGLLSMSGLSNESMVRDHGWHFMEAGRRIERAIHVAMLVGSTLGSERSALVESIVVESVLVAGESIITSRRRSRSRADAATAIGLLFDDATNPRSLRFQIDRLREAVSVLAADRATATSSTVPGLLSELTQMLERTDAARLAAVDQDGHRNALEGFVRFVREKLSAVSDAIGAESFARLHSQHLLAPAAQPGFGDSVRGDLA